MTDNIPVQIQRLLLEDKRTPYVNSRYQHEASMQVVVRLIEKNILTEADKQPIVEALKPIEAWIEGYTELIEALPHPVCKILGCEGKADRLVLDQDFCKQHAEELSKFINGMKPIESAATEGTEPAPNGKRAIVKEKA